MQVFGGHAYADFEDEVALSHRVGQSQAITGDQSMEDRNHTGEVSAESFSRA